MEKPQTYILAGGRSSRFGTDKSRALLDGTPMLLRVARMLEPVAASITVVADSPEKYADLGLRTIADAVPRCGPLGGLFTAFEDLSAAGWVLLVPCDLVRVDPQWCELLSAHAQPPAEAVAFKDRYLEPFPALYHSSLRERARARLSCPENSLQDLMNDAHTVSVPIPDDWPEVFQVNTQADWQRADAAVRESKED